MCDFLHLLKSQQPTATDMHVFMWGHVLKGSTKVVFIIEVVGLRDHDHNEPTTLFITISNLTVHF